MEKDFTVHVETRTTDDKRRIEVFQFSDYAWRNANALKQMLYEFEQTISRLENAEGKDGWSEETKREYADIRRKALNVSNAFLRLPQTLCYKGVPCCNIAASDMLAALIDG